MILAFNDHQRSRALTSSTIARRSADLRKFERWLEPRGMIDATPADIDDFLASRRWAPVTRCAFLSNLHAFYRWAVTHGHVGSDPTLFVDRPRTPAALPRPIGDDDLVFVVTEADPVMRAWLLLGSHAGLRCMEIAGLTRPDVCDTEGLLRVAGKGRRERLVPLHPAVLEALLALPMPRRGPIFTDAHGRPYRPSRISQLINAWMREMGVDSTAHKLRHWFGTHTYRECQDLLAVAGLLGHANTTMTMRYAAFSPEVGHDAVMALPTCIRSIREAA